MQVCVQCSSLDFKNNHYIHFYIGSDAKKKQICEI
jgi:hypothetical protein